MLEKDNLRWRKKETKIFHGLSSQITIQLEIVKTYFFKLRFVLKMFGFHVQYIRMVINFKNSEKNFILFMNIHKVLKKQILKC